MVQAITCFLMLFATVASFVTVEWMRGRQFDADRITLAITLIGTLFGVLYALWIGDLYQRSRERNRLSNLYVAAGREFDAKLHVLGERIKFASALGARILGDVELPKVIDGIRDDTSLHQFFSPTMTEHVYSGLGSSSYQAALQFIALAPEGKSGDKTYAQGLIMLYCQMDLQRRFIDAERQYLRRRISASQLSDLWVRFGEEEDRQREEIGKQTWRIVDTTGNPTGDSSGSDQNRGHET